MTGFNLPPGVSVWMIPGNRPEDEEDEKFWSAFDAAMERGKIAVPEDVYDEDWFAQAVYAAREIGYERGRADEREESEIEKALAQEMPL